MPAGKAAKTTSTANKRVGRRWRATSGSFPLRGKPTHDRSAKANNLVSASDAELHLAQIGLLVVVDCDGERDVKTLGCAGVRKQLSRRAAGGRRRSGPAGPAHDCQAD